MGLLIFFIGIILILFGAKGLITYIWAKTQCYQKFGQVVGFCEEKKGSYQVVLRFKAFNKSEYFLVDHKASLEPAFVMGEFVPILLSLKDHKKALMSPQVSLFKNLAYLLFGFFTLALNSVFFTFSASDVFIIAIITCAVFLYITQFKKLNPIRNFFNGLNLFDQTEMPQIIDIENSKLINWTENYIGQLPQDLKQPFSFQFLKRPLRAMCLLSAGISIFLSVSSYKSILSQLSEAHRYQGRYDRSVLYDAFFGVELHSPQIRFFDKNRKLFNLTDTKNPFDINLKAGDKVTVLVSKNDPQNMRRDLGHLNQWRAYLFASLGFLFLLLSSSSKPNKKNEKKAPVIRIKKAG